MPEGEVVQSKKSFMGMPVSSASLIKTTGDVASISMYRTGFSTRLSLEDRMLDSHSNQEQGESSSFPESMRYILLAIYQLS